MWVCIRLDSVTVGKSTDQLCAENIETSADLMQYSRGLIYHPKR